MKILSFNANGLRSATGKGFFEWVPALDADLICIQETKAQEHQLRVPAMLPDGYTAYFRDAITKKGYSGVAVYTRRQPDEVVTAVRFPTARSTRAACLELAPRRGDFAVVGVAVAVHFTGDGTVVDDIGLAAFGVGAVPMRLGQAEAQVRGVELTAEVAELAGVASSEDVERPTTDIHASGDYRRRALVELVRRALEGVAGVGQSAGG